MQAKRRIVHVYVAIIRTFVLTDSKSMNINPVAAFGYNARES